jgi:hypothetical protein
MGILGDHRDIARIALKALKDRRVGGRFGLGGGNALNAHGLLERMTEDVDVFLGREEDVAAAAAVIREALADAGYRVDSVDHGGLGDLWPDEDDEVYLADWEVTTGGEGGQRTVKFQAGFFALLADPVTIDGLQVIGLDDVMGHKVVALGSRGMARDMADVAAFLEKFTAAELVTLAVERDQGLLPEYFVDAMQRLDRLPDSRLAAVLRGTGWTPGRVRGNFADWPRDQAAGEKWWAGITAGGPGRRADPAS